MRNKQKIAVPILADREVFDYLKEKVGERKTKTEAYCDLLDKALSGFVSPFLRKQDYELRPNQCHVTVSDLASEWHWHRATVRSFLDAMEAFGLLNRTRLPKSVVITMTVQSGQSVEPYLVQEQPDFAEQIRDVLSDWVIGCASVLTDADAVAVQSHCHTAVGIAGMDKVLGHIKVFSHDAREHIVGFLVGRIRSPIRQCQHLTLGNRIGQQRRIMSLYNQPVAPSVKRNMGLKTVAHQYIVHFGL